MLRVYPARRGMNRSAVSDWAWHWSPAWWTAVEQLRGRCVVVICATGTSTSPTTSPATSSQPLIGSGRAVYAALPVTTLLPD
jgi:hypothetical protein